MPNLTIDYGGGKVDMWQVQQDRDSRKGSVDVRSSPTFDSDQAFLSGMTEGHSATVSGTATGHRLSNQSGYSNDPVTALAEWTQTVMSLIDGKQGKGYTLTHDRRGLDVNIVIEEFSWTRRQAAKFQVEWDLSYKIGTGAMVDGTKSQNTASPSSTWKLDGNDLQYPREYSEKKTQRLKVEEMMLVDSPEKNRIKTQGGAEREVTITGRHTGSRSARESFDNTMRGLMGSNTIVTYESPFPGHNIDVMVDNFSSTLEAGLTRQTDYDLTLKEGTN